MSKRYHLAALRLFLLTGILGTTIAAKPNIILLKNNLKQVNQVTEALIYELRSDFSFIEINVSKDTPVENVARAISVGDPVAIVLLSNEAVSVYRGYQQSRKDKKFVPAITLMAVGINLIVKELVNVTGIYYDIPVVSVVYSLRNLTKKKVDTIGIIHREFMEDIINANIDYCKNEHVTLTPLKLPNKVKELDKVLYMKFDNYIKENSIDFLIIPTDNILLNPDYIENVYKPIIRKHEIPVIVGVETLASKSSRFASFSIVPDYENLGIQAAELIKNIQTNKWTIPPKRLSVPVSKYEIINISSQKTIKLIDKEAVNEADKVIK